MEKNKTNRTSKKENETSNNQRSLSEIELIHQESETIYYSNTFFLYFLFLVLLWVIVDYIIEKSIFTLQQFCFWFFELIFLSFFIMKFLKPRYILMKNIQ